MNRNQQNHHPSNMKQQARYQGSFRHPFNRNFKVTSKRVELACERNTLHKQVGRLEESWKKLNKMYKSLQSDYGRMRANYTIMTVSSRRLHDENLKHDGKIADLQSAKVNLEAKIELLEEKVRRQEAETKNISLEKIDAKDYALAKDARIKAIKNAIDEVRVQLGPWGCHNIPDDDIDKLFKDVDELL